MIGCTKAGVIDDASTVSTCSGSFEVVRLRIGRNDVKNFNAHAHIISMNTIFSDFRCISSDTSPSSAALEKRNNRRFPRSMRSQGERPGCGSHVKRVDTEMLSTHDVALRNVDGSLFHVQI